MKWPRRDQLGSFELMVILVLIRLGENTYGFPICEELEKHTGRDVAIDSVYAALERLEDKGFVTSEIGEPTRTRWTGEEVFPCDRQRIEGSGRDQRSLVRLWQGLPELQGGKA